MQVFQGLGINVVHIELQTLENGGQTADVLVDIECDSKNLDQVIRMLKREVHSVNYTTSVAVGDTFPPPTPLSAQASFGKLINFVSLQIYKLRKIS